MRGRITLFLLLISISIAAFAESESVTGAPHEVNFFTWLLSQLPF